VNLMDYEFLRKLLKERSGLDLSADKQYLVESRLLPLARKAGLRLALITGEKSPIVDRLAVKMGVTDVYQDCKDKARALRSLAEHHQLRLEDICFMGDDVNDLSALEIAGLAAAPSNARPAILEKCQFITKAPAGNGAVRELIDHLLAHATMGTSGESTVK